jgi:low affinity Fe/Cu permease
MWRRSTLGPHRTLVRLFRYMAARDQYGHHHRYFPLIFLVQHTQNRDARALHLKLDELLRSLDRARNRLINLETCTDEEINQIERQFKALRAREERDKVTH